MSRPNDLFFTNDFANAISGVGSLAALDVAIQATKVDGNRDSGVFIPWIEYAIHFNHGAADEEVIVGISTNMSAAEVEEHLEADPQSRTDHSQLEKAQRGMIKILGTNLSRTGELTKVVPLDSSWAKEKIGWTIPEDNSFSIWAYNPGGSALNASSTVTVDMRIAQRWLRD